MNEWGRYSRQNQRAWNEIAELRSKTWAGARTGEYFRAGGCTLDRRVIAATGDVTNRRLLHLMCATGEETLSWAVLGADAVGVDISDRHVSIARSRAEESGLSARFEAADVGELPPQLADRSFDCVYTGGGVLVWVPELGRWAASIAAALKPGGRFVLWEEHPVAMCLWGVDGKVEIVESYFHSGEPERSTGWTHFPGAEDAQEGKYEFTWPLGEIVTHLVRAGLRLEELAEYPSTADWRFGSALEEARKLPGMLLLVAAREA